MEITIEQYDAYSPLFAYLGQKTQEQREKILERFSNLSETQRQKLVGVETVEQLVSFVEQGIVPETYAKAVSTIICLVTLGDITAQQVPQLLEKLSSPTDITDRIVSAIQPLLKTPPPPPEVRLPPIPEPMQPLPPLTTKIPNRNIIDLRPPAGEAGTQKPNA